MLQHCLLKKLSLLLYVAFVPASKTSSLYLCKSIFGLSIHLIDLFFLSFHQYQVLLITIAL